MYELLESFFFFSPSQGPLTNPLGAEHQIKQTPSVDMVVRSYSTHSSTCLFLLLSTAKQYLILWNANAG